MRHPILVSRKSIDNLKWIDKLKSSTVETQRSQPTMSLNGRSRRFGQAARSGEFCVAVRQSKPQSAVPTIPAIPLSHNSFLNFPPFPQFMFRLLVAVAVTLHSITCATFPNLQIFADFTTVSLRGFTGGVHLRLHDVDVDSESSKSPAALTESNFNSLFSNLLVF
jgi:hypothetical protein